MTANPITFVSMNMPSPGYLRCFELFAQRDYEGCARASRPLIDVAGTHELLQIFLISLIRSGQHKMMEGLIPNVNAATEHDPWVNALLRLTMGLTGPDQVRALMRDPRQRCVGSFYIGANQLTHGYRTEADRSYDVCLEAGFRCTEADLARLEKTAPAVSIAGRRGGMTAEQFDWFDRRAGAARAALQSEQRDQAAAIAEEMYQRACDSLDENGVGMGATLQQIAIIHFELGDYETARPMFEEARDLFLENWGPRHRMHVECLKQLAAIEAAAGSASKTSDLLNEHRRLQALTLGAADMTEA